MSTVIQMELWQFSLIYFLLIIVLIVMKICKVNQSKLLIIGSIRMTIQLTLAGLILTYIFENPNPILTVTYFMGMIIFAVYRVLSKNKGLNKRFQIRIAISLFLPGLLVTIYFIKLVVGEDIFNAQYVIPIAGMVMGNSMTGATLGIKTFRESLEGQKSRIDALLCIGADPKQILIPFVRQALETALLPTMNNMVGMGIVSLPGMMTGQILSGTLPMTAILYQIAIMIAICTVVCTSSFGSLYLGYRTLYNKRNQIEIS